jgi:hypothetical protein
MNRSAEKNALRRADGTCGVCSILTTGVRNLREYAARAGAAKLTDTN